MILKKQLIMNIGKTEFDDYEKPYDYSLFDEPDDIFFDE